MINTTGYTEFGHFGAKNNSLRTFKKYIFGKIMVFFGTNAYSGIRNGFIVKAGKNLLAFLDILIYFPIMYSAGPL